MPHKHSYGDVDNSIPQYELPSALNATMIIRSKCWLLRWIFSHLVQDVLGTLPITSIPSPSTVVLQRPLLEWNKGNTSIPPLYYYSCPGTNTLVDSKAITEKNNTVWVMVTLMKCKGKQPTLRKVPPFRESKSISVSDNIANIRLCMTNDHPKHNLHPILGMASAHFDKENTYHAPSSCQNC